eukprot:TRINITY_DN1652_c0_g1_i1.p1 TRINITY_DN1652_c0_g1~~TRINITY_DN1652_c0_g1_i1.p1  ORF type:complete len:463 (+),score=121.38 TRINITY_DN1652_c0_g1_i1:139-1527(+)
MRTLLLATVLSAALVAGQVCQLVVPAQPLTGTGLATPWILQNVPGDTTNDCTQIGGTNSAFVEAVVFDTATGSVGVYRPLVVNNVNQIAISPNVPTISATSVVGIWVGFNGKTLTLVSTSGTTSVTDGNCVNMATGNTQVFGAFAYCNAPTVFNAMQNAVLQGTYTLPTLANAADGQPCPTSRDILIVDQNPSSGIAGSQLVTTKGLLAQDNFSNQQIIGAGQFTQVQVAQSNNHNLLNNFLLPAMGCAPVSVNDLADPNKALVPSLAVNEIVADMLQAAPQAVVSRNSPMTQVNAAFNLAQLNAYRAGVNQPSVQDNDATPGTDICNNLGKVALPRLMANSARLATVHSPIAANNMFNYMLIRMNATFTAMNCAGLGVANPTTGVAFVGNNFPATLTSTTTGGGAAAAGGGNTLVAGMNNSTLIGVGVGAGVGILAVGGAVAYFVKRRGKTGNAILMDSFL